MPLDKDKLSAYFKKLGAKGGNARKEHLSKKERSEQARKAAIARWKARKDKRNE